MSLKVQRLETNPNWESNVSKSALLLVFNKNDDIVRTYTNNKCKKWKIKSFHDNKIVQLISALNGLTLIQNIRHPSSHNIEVRNLDTNEFERQECVVNSIHHQIPWTNNKLEGENFKVYGYTQLSPVHEYQKDEKITCFVEPEIIHFPKTNSIGVQFHPEMMGNYPLYKDIQSYLERLINKLF